VVGSRRLAVTGLAAAGVVLAVLGTAGWVAAQGGVAPDVAAAGEVDAVVALVGDPGRLAPAAELAEDSGATLVISQRTRASAFYGVGDRRERCAAATGDGVVCFVSQPYATRGEARAVDRLAAARGWDHVAVVTSRYHLRRAGLLVRQCLPDAQVDLIAADDALSPVKVAREVVALGAAVTIHRAC
jgi:uncharacterized SAM-binding protein YcdF (DUF218 family)